MAVDRGPERHHAGVGGSGLRFDKDANERAIPYPSHCPVASLRTWLTVSATQSGPVFRKSDRSGHIRQSRLGVGGARCVVERRASATQALTAG